MLLNANETICPCSLLFLPLGPHPLGWAKYIVLQFCFLFPSYWYSQSSLYTAH
jgi:hypothetical protein